MKAATIKKMTDEQIEEALGTLSREKDRRQTKYASDVGISLSKDPDDWRDDRRLFKTPLGDLLVWSWQRGMPHGSNVQICGEDLSNIAYSDGDYPDDVVEKWQDTIDNELQDDACDVLESRTEGACLKAAIKLYKKYEELLKLISVQAVQEG